MRLPSFTLECSKEAYRGIVPQHLLERATFEGRELRWHDRSVSGGRRTAVAHRQRGSLGPPSRGVGLNEPGSPYVASNGQGRCLEQAENRQRSLGAADINAVDEFLD